jgi:4-hydroxybenzoate polyprenyltransferase
MLRGLAGACHPLPTIAVTTVATVLAVGVGLRWPQVVILAFAVFTGQLSIGWSNDRIDSARDVRAGRADKPVATGSVPPAVVTIAAGSALLATVVLSAQLGLPAALAALTLVAAGWAYNLGLKSTVFSGAAYVVGFGALPIVPYLALPGHPWPPWWVPVTGALLGLAAHFANVLPDLRADAETGVRGLPHRLGARGSVIAMASILAVAALVLGIAPRSTSAGFAIVASVVGIGTAAAAAAFALRRPESPAAFRLTMAIAMLDVILLLIVAT